MYRFRANTVGSIWLIALLLGGSGLILTASGQSSSEAADPPKETKPKADDPAAKEPPREQMYQAEFMGTKSTGRRFCIIADASNSMHGGKLPQLKKELIKTLEGLNPESQFYIIYFNVKDIPMPSPNWLVASKENVNKIKPWINGMTTKLHTFPQTSFDRAFKLNPKPDVIYFLTDGFLQNKPDPITQVGKLNMGNPRVVIHTIRFTKAKDEHKGGDKAGTQLRTLAEKNGGTYRHVKCAKE